MLAHLKTVFLVVPNIVPNADRRCLLTRNHWNVETTDSIPTSCCWQQEGFQSKSVAMAAWVFSEPTDLSELCWQSDQAHRVHCDFLGEFSYWQIVPNVQNSKCFSRGWKKHLRFDWNPLSIPPSRMSFFNSLQQETLRPFIPPSPCSNIYDAITWCYTIAIFF